MEANSRYSAANDSILQHKVLTDEGQSSTTQYGQEVGVFLT